MRAEHVYFRIRQQKTHSELISRAYPSLINGGLVILTRSKLNHRIEALEEQWLQFHINDKAINLAITKLEEEDQREIMRHPYFVEKHYFSTYDCYLDTSEKIKALLLSSTSSSPPVLTTLESNYNLSSSSQEPSTFAQSDHRNSFLPTNVTTTSPCQVVSTGIQASHHLTRAPRLELPKYDGNLSDWLSFRDLFVSMIYTNESLSPVEKLQYLKISLVGPASHLLRNTNLTAANFAKAWQAVVSFYENQRLLIRAAFKSLHSVKKLPAESASNLQHLYTTFEDAYRNLESLNRPVQYYDDFLVYMAEERLDPESAKAWEQHLGSSTDPATWNCLKSFILSRMRSLQAFEHLPRPQLEHRRRHFQPTRVHFSGTFNQDSSQSSKDLSCILCSEKHSIQVCKLYKNKTVPQRKETVIARGLCFNCLGSHRISNCRSSRRCVKCGQRHHTTLHRSERLQPAKQTSNEDTAKQSIHAQSNSKPIVLLATAKVKVINERGDILLARGLLDQGSEVSLITENLAQCLGLRRKSSSAITILGLGTKSAGKTKGQVKLTIYPHFSTATQFTINAYILPQLTSKIPTVPIPQVSWSRLQALTLADPDFTTPGNIDFIIGADFFGELLEESIIKHSSRTLVAQQTKLGWIVSGSLNSTSTNKAQSYQCSVDWELNKLLEKFWHQEEIRASSKSTLSAEDQQCEDHYVSTHTRDSDGRYIVRLPFKASPTQLGDSKGSALRMLHLLQRKFQSNPEFFKAYSLFLSEYHSLQHMVEVKEIKGDNFHGFYLPHHGVIRESSLTTKLRVVFNGSCRTTGGPPLNEILFTGAKLQTDIFDVLMYYRLYKYVFSTDMERMYRQIKIHPDDWKYQMILWNDDDKIVSFFLTTVTYGLACSPFLALRTILQLLHDEGHNFPNAIKPLTIGRYVDDIFGGADTITEAQKQADQIRQLCLAGGFTLKKWISNRSDVLAKIPLVDQLTVQSIQLKDNEVRALGLFWNPPTDSLHFKFSSSPTVRVTKRTVLSKIAQLFDPLGLLSPVFIQLKIFMQELWAVKLNWDDELASPQINTWNRLQQLLNGLETIEIPRWSGFNSSGTIEFHGFSDASQLAMAAVVYIKTKFKDQLHVALLCSKTKVAPLKRITIPRLELSAAVMLTKLVHHCRTSLSFEAARCYLWTDSSIVHTWINNHPSKWKDFIHNRVCYIQETLPLATWRHVSGKENPADCATRGIAAMNLRNHLIWWSGPAWLIKNNENWPSVLPHQPQNPQDLEQRVISSAVTFHTAVSSSKWELISRYSSLTRLLRITAILRRALSRMRKEVSPEICDLARVPLTPGELNEALLHWIRLTQNENFKMEIASLQGKNELPRSSALFRLLAFIDDNNLLRVGGRLKNSSLSANAKQPYILPKHSELTKLIIQDAHYKTLHGSTQDTLNYIRNTCWILGGRSPVRSFILKCVTCARFRQSRAKHIMGQLPPSRVNSARAFLHSGVDYAGPFIIKTWRGRASKTYKSWVALFVCQATSAIHLELVTDYTTDAFIAAYKRFISRRGICATLSSDCGTNFKGANREIRQLFQQCSLSTSKIASLIANDGTKWNFNPPASPHFGGKWEAGVKSMKYHLKRVVGENRLTYEEMTTILAQIEAILNSRPLCSLTNDPDDMDVLTPGHFLIGQSLTLIPEPNLENIQFTKLSRWQHLSQIVQCFWRKWSRGYLQRFQSVYKWNKPVTPITEGDLVFIVDERYPPSKWPLGRVIKAQPGPDSVVRVVTLKTSTGIVVRPVVKVCLLPLSSTNDSISPADPAKAGGKC